jgi:small subunit ribosomal protein S1
VGRHRKPSTRRQAQFTGRVTNITDYGAFVELEPGIEGLIHVSEMSWTKKNVHPGKIVSTSRKSKWRSSKSTRTSAASRWASSRPCPTRGKNFARVPCRHRSRRRSQEQDRVRSVHRPRRRCRRHGAPVRSRLEPSGRTGHREYNKGDMVKAIVLDVDVDKERISLGIKQLGLDPRRIRSGEIRKNARSSPARSPR